MNTVTVGLNIWGKDYVQFLPGWWDAVLALQRQPDEILLGVGESVLEDVFDSIPEGVTATVFLLEVDGHGEAWNQQIEECSSDWLALCPADDRFTPEALNDVDNAGDAEIIVDAIRYLGSGEVWRGSWDFTHVRSIMPAPQLCIARKSLYKRVGGVRNDIRWQDWAFYIDAYLAGARVFRSDIVRLVFDEGLNRVTESGRSLDRGVRDWADAQLRDYAASRGL